MALNPQRLPDNCPAGTPEVSAAGVHEFSTITRARSTTLDAPRTNCLLLRGCLSSGVPLHPPLKDRKKTSAWSWLFKSNSSDEPSTKKGDSPAFANRSLTSRSILLRSMLTTIPVVRCPRIVYVQNPSPTQTVAEGCPECRTVYRQTSDRQNGFDRATPHCWNSNQLPEAHLQHGYRPGEGRNTANKVPR